MPIRKSISLCALAASFLLGGWSQATAAQTESTDVPRAPSVDSSANPEAIDDAATEAPATAEQGGQYNPEAIAPSLPTPETAVEAETAGSDQDTGDALPSGTGRPSDVDAGPARVEDIRCREGQVCRERGTGLPFRLLPRSFSNVYESREVSADNIVVENVRAFYPLYVFAREGLDVTDPARPKGWYQVSDSVSGPPLGWMRAGDVLEWKQALLVSYTHPGSGEEARGRVLMFKDLSELKQIVESPLRDQYAIFLYANIEQGEAPPALASKEPERFVDITRTFYLLPIVNFEMVDIEGDAARYLQLAAAVPEKRGSDTLENREYFEEAQQTGELKGELGETLGVDIVFVMDMTQSMQPYIDRTKQEISALARSLADDDVKRKVHFGLVGYRDDVSKMPRLLFTRKNFTPQLLVVDEFTKILERDARVIRLGSADYPEEVFAGVEMGLESKWTEHALRFMILVGDASSHPEGHEQNTTGKNAEVLKLAARDANVHVMALHLLDPRMPADHSIAAKQFALLSQMPGPGGESALVQIDTVDEQGFSEAVQQIATVVFDTIEEAAGTAGPSEAEQPGPAAREGAGGQAKEKMERLMDSALVEYLGREANPPKDIVVWALDRDLTDPAIRAMEVRVLVNKEQLSDLITALGRVIEAMQRAQMTQVQFFEALQSVAGQTLKDPDAIGVAGRLVDSGLLPAFINSLPYKSEILSLTQEMWASMTAEHRAALESSLRAKLEQYRDINEQVDGWVKLNVADPESRKVYPLLLDYFP